MNDLGVVKLKWLCQTLYELNSKQKQRGIMNQAIKKITFPVVMKAGVIGLLLSSVFLTGFTCSKNNPSMSNNNQTSEIQAEQKDSVPQEQMTTETTTETSDAAVSEENK